MMHEDLLYKLALRLSTFYGDPKEDHPTLLVEKLPETFPIHILIPEASHILGTLIRGPQSIQVMLDVPLTALEISDFYKRELLASGWSLPEMGMGVPHQGGFMHNAFGGIHYSRYEHTSDWSLTVQIGKEEQSLTDVRLQFNRDNNSVSSRRRQQRFHGPDMFAILPPLAPPEGGEQQGGGGSSGTDSVHTDATLKLPEVWPIADLTRHYTDQLIQASWTLTAEEKTEHTAWSTWKFHDNEDEEWVAAFYLFQLGTEPTHYQLSLHADWKDPTPQNDSWFSIKS